MMNPVRRRFKSDVMFREMQSPQAAGLAAR
jgi:hypothetical protein